MKTETVNDDGSWHVENRKDGKLHGKCERVNSDGSWYADNWKDGEPHGKASQSGWFLACPDFQQWSSHQHRDLRGLGR